MASLENANDEPSNEDRAGFFERIIKHHHIDSRFYIYSTIIAIAIAMLTAHESMENRAEDVRRQAEDAKRQAEDTRRQVAQDTFQGRIWCVEGADRLRSLLTSKQNLYNKMQTIYDIRGMERNCNQVGQPLPLNEVLSILGKLALDEDTKVANSAARASRYLNRRIRTRAAEQQSNAGYVAFYKEYAENKDNSVPVAGVPIRISNEDPRMPKLCRKITVDVALAQGETTSQIWCLKGDSWTPYIAPAP